VITRKQANRKESGTVKVVRAELLRRIKAVARERDALRNLISDCEALAASCDDALEALQLGVDALSRYA
jgi:ribosomal protein L10